MKTGRLELIIGPMFSGKSTKLIEYLDRYESIGKSILKITHPIDNRYGDNIISSHNNIQRSCIGIENLKDVFSLDEYKNSEIILLEEGQFFKDLKIFAKKVVDDDNKYLIISGLSGDYRREPFGELFDLIPIADSIEKLSAFCKKCNDGTLGIFTKRIVKNNETILVGNNDSYIPVCRYHYNHD